MNQIRIYVEGGGDESLTKSKCRKGFSELFGKVVSKKPKVIACGGRQKTYEYFKLAFSQHQEAIVILLVDSEGAVSSRSVWDHLRKIDNWDSSGFPDESAHLMVQTMESWFLADKKMLKEFYGQGFTLKPLLLIKTLKK